MLGEPKESATKASADRSRGAVWGVAACVACMFGLSARAPAQPPQQLPPPGNVLRVVGPQTTGTSPGDVLQRLPSLPAHPPGEMRQSFPVQNKGYASPPDLIIEELARKAAASGTALDLAQIREQVLWPLMLQEKMLRVDLGPGHPDLISVRTRIDLVYQFLQQQSAAQAARAQAAQSQATAAPAKEPLTEKPAPDAPTAIAAGIGQSEASSPPSQPVAAPPGLLAGSGSLLESSTNDGYLESSWVRITHQPMSSSHQEASAPPTELISAEQAVATDPLPPAESQAAVLPAEAPLLATWIVGFLKVIAAIVFGLLLHLAVLLLAVRRYGPRLAPLFRVELVNAQGGELAGFVAPTMVASSGQHDTSKPAPDQSHLEAGDPSSLEELDRCQDAAEDLAGLNPLKLFDPGPSYEEERRIQEEAEKDQAQALLLSIFEQNLELRKQLEDSTRAAV